MDDPTPRASAGLAQPGYSPTATTRTGPPARSPDLCRDPDRGGNVLACAGCQLALLAGMTGVFFPPGYFSAHSRRDLRRLIAGKPRVRAEIEEPSRSRVDPVETMSLGPP